MSQPDFEPLANEALGTIAEIAERAVLKLQEAIPASGETLAVGNTLTHSRAYENLDALSRKALAAWQGLASEPVIARLLVEDDDGKEQIYYISRRTSMALTGAAQLASYASPIGHLASLPVGEEGIVSIKGKSHHFYVVEKTTLQPSRTETGWDSLKNVYRHEKLGVYSIESLRSLLLAEGVAAGDELDRLLEQAAAASGVSKGITHQIRTAMELRDQPILDQFQDEIFRLPLDSQLLILGPPGTGKTTTLIKRLGQKLDGENLDEGEMRLVKDSPNGLTHQTSWLMFTPSELLKHYLKEAFSREQVPASDERIKTWISYRNDVARNVLGILRTPNGGRFTYKTGSHYLSSSVEAEPRGWFEAFRQFHFARLIKQLNDGAVIAKTAAQHDQHPLMGRLTKLLENAGGKLLVVYRELNALESSIRPVLEAIKSETEDLLKKERNLLFNQNKMVFNELARLLDDLQQDDEDTDDDAEFDEDDADAEEAVNPTQPDMEKAVKAYLACIRTLARHHFRKRSLPKSTRAAKIRDWLGERVPSDSVLLKIGQSMTFQNGLRRFMNASKRYVLDVPTSYRQFRKLGSDGTDHYQELPTNSFHVTSTELDAIVLLVLKSARELLAESFVNRELDSPRFASLRNVIGLFRNQIMVDEATDFSVLQLSCMSNLAALRTRSFFACGDFNQRVTSHGLRSIDQIAWAVPTIETKRITTVYRQSRELNAFAASLLTLIGGDLTALGKLPDESIHDGVKPALVEGVANNGGAAKWIYQRIADVERSVKQMPTIAVLVNAETDVKPMAEELTKLLEDINLKAVACEEGKALGEGSDVRVFDIQHIKGLEFEAVFFAGIDKLAEISPELFDRYLYVGTTRAATYLGMACCQTLPGKLEALRSAFIQRW